MRRVPARGGCEEALAAAFAPRMMVDERECGWDAEDGRLGGGYLYVVGRRRGSERVRIAYLPAYHVDCGWHAPICVVHRRTCRPHTGDSEAVVVEVAFEATSARWRTEAVFLSAHCHGRSDGRCRWFRGVELERFSWVDGAEHGAPVVWVARGKHANYPSRRDCDSGYWYVESCDGNRVAYRFPVVRVPRLDGRCDGIGPGAVRTLPSGKGGAVTGSAWRGGGWA